MCVDGDALLDQYATHWMIWHLRSGPRVGAVTGNPRIRNRSTLLGRLQVGEFSAIIGMIKRAQRGVRAVPAHAPDRALPAGSPAAPGAGQRGGADRLRGVQPLPIRRQERRRRHSPVAPSEVARAFGGDPQIAARLSGSKVAILLMDEGARPAGVIDTMTLDRQRSRPWSSLVPEIA